MNSRARWPPTDVLPGFAKCATSHTNPLPLQTSLATSSTAHRNLIASMGCRRYGSEYPLYAAVSRHTGSTECASRSNACAAARYLSPNPYTSTSDRSGISIFQKADLGSSSSSLPLPLPPFVRFSFFFCLSSLGIRSGTRAGPRNCPTLHSQKQTPPAQNAPARCT